MRTNTVRTGFACRDLLGSLAVALVALALLASAAQRMRQQSISASSLSQLRWIAGITSSYAADNADRYWNFSWTAGATPSAYPDLQTASTDLIAAANQAIDILRRRGRPDMPRPIAWIPHVLYSHLPLIDYLDRDIPDFNFVSPADANRLAWARDPAGFDAGAFLPLQPAPSATEKRWPYSASFEQPPAFYDQSDIGSRIMPGATQAQYSIPSTAVLGAWRISDVAYPGRKAHIFDAAQRDLGASDRFFADEGADVPIAFADGSAGVRASRDANGGWKPNRPTDPTPSRFAYEPAAWDPQGTTAGEILLGHYRWTRGGIFGRDFGGPEIDTGQP
ncbi:MAG: hypothetical protein ACF8R7_02420 [Phycisphaerales bacterium JB039]